MEEKTGIVQLKSMLTTVFGITPGTVDRMMDVLQSKGELSGLHLKYMSLDGITRKFIQRTIESVDKVADEPQDDQAEDEAAFDGEREALPDETEEAPETQTRRFEGFKGGFQDFLKEVTISVDSEDPDARAKFQAQLRKAQASDQGAMMVARQNVADRVQARKTVSKDAPDAMQQQREMKRREMVAREERRRLQMQKQQGM